MFERRKPAWFGALVISAFGALSCATSEFRKICDVEASPPPSSVPASRWITLSADDQLTIRLANLSKQLSGEAARTADDLAHMHRLDRPNVLRVEITKVGYRDACPLIARLDADATAEQREIDEHIRKLSGGR